MYLKTLNILVAEWIKIPVQGLSPLLERKIHERLVFTNPDYEARHNRGEWLGNIPPQINCIQKTSRHYLLPRGFLDQLVELCKKFQQPFRLVDRRRSFDPIPIEFHGYMKDYQQEAAEAILTRDFATLMGGHKSGKTVIALYSIAQRCQPTLILIPKLDLLDGWLTKIANFLQIPSEEVGVLTEDIHRLGKWLTIAHTSEILRHWRTIRDQIGYLIIDECQRCPSKILTNILPKFDCRYVLGLTNTTQRRDKLSRFIYYYVGDVVYTINEKDAKEGRGIIHAHVVARNTEFDYPYQSRADYDSMLQALMRDEVRTRLIADDIQKEIAERGAPLLILSGGAEQNEVISAELERRGIEALSYTEHESRDVESSENEEDAPCEIAMPDIGQEPMPHRPVAILVTSQVLMRCFRNLSSKVLFLAVPVFFRSRLAYAIRNLNQNGNGMQERIKIYDYVDSRVGLLENYFRMRSYNYGVHPDVLRNSN